MYNLIYILAVIAVSLMAGLFYNWSFNITTGLAKLDDRSYLSIMQIFNKSILNPTFYLIFIGSFFTLPLLTFLHGNKEIDLSFWILVFATIFYLIGSMGITFWGNIPMNNKLEALNLLLLTNDECFTFRQGFELKWNTLNFIRTGTSIISMALLLIPLFIKIGK